MSKHTQKLIIEIESVIAPKLFNIKKGTASERERQVVAECQGFLSLIKHSTLLIKEIKRLWDQSNLSYM